MRGVGLCGYRRAIGSAVLHGVGCQPQRSIVILPWHFGKVVPCRASPSVLQRMFLTLDASRPRLYARVRERRPIKIILPSGFHRPPALLRRAVACGLSTGRQFEHQRLALASDLGIYAPVPVALKLVSYLCLNEACASSMLL